MKAIRFALCVLFLAGCAGSDIPTLEDSNSTIRALQPKLAMMESLIEQMKRPPDPARDVTVKVNVRAMNAMFDAFSGNRSDDVRLLFLPARRVVEEYKSAMGIPYTNYIDIDSGRMAVNLKKIHISSAKSDRLVASLSMSGEGAIHVTGKYTAITASAHPSVRVTVNDSVRFRIARNQDAQFVLTPEPGTVQLRTTISTKLLGWDIPYTHTTPLNVTDLIQPLPLPITSTSSLQMPVPNELPGDRLKYIPVSVSVKDLSTGIAAGWISTSFNVHFPLPETP